MRAIVLMTWEHDKAMHENNTLHMIPFSESSLGQCTVPGRSETPGTNWTAGQARVGYECYREARVGTGQL